MGATGLCLGVRTGGEFGLAVIPGKVPEPGHARSREYAMNTQIDRDNAIEKLRELVPQGATIYVLLRRKNALGTCRWLEFYHIRDNELRCITWDVAQAIDGPYCRQHDALRVTGAGLDVGYASVDHLSQVLFGTGHMLRHKWL